MNAESASAVPLDSSEIFLNRELSWLAFARRVLDLTLDSELPLLERVKFVGIMGMLHDEFFMKRISRLKHQVRMGITKKALDGMLPSEELDACREEIRRQMGVLSRVMTDEIRPAMSRAGIPILEYAELTAGQAGHLQEYFISSVLPLLTPLAVDAEHPFPFISGQGLNLAILSHEERAGRERFVRPGIKAELGRILDVYEEDNSSRWDCRQDGSYERRRPKDNEPRRGSQEIFMKMARRQGIDSPAGKRSNKARKE